MDDSFYSSLSRSEANQRSPNSGDNAIVKRYINLRGKQKSRTIAKNKENAPMAFSPKENIIPPVSKERKNLRNLSEINMPNTETSEFSSDPYQTKTFNQKASQIYFRKSNAKQLVTSFMPLKPLDKRSLPKEGEGDLINYNMETVSGEVDKNRPNYYVIPQASKLSQIILNTPKNINVIKTRSSSKKKQDPKYLYITDNDDKKPEEKIKNKFRLLSLSYIKAHGPKKESFIYRKNRKDKGGVVDLATCDSNNKSTHSVSNKEKGKKRNKCASCEKPKVSGEKYVIRRAKSPHQPKSNAQSPEKYSHVRCAKTIQKFWRTSKLKFIPVINSIKLIQSYWRGYYLRKYVFDVIYLALYCENFFDKVRSAMKKIVRRENFPLLFGRSFTRSDFLRKYIQKGETRSTPEQLKKKFFKKFKTKTLSRDAMLGSVIRFVDNLMKCVADHERLEKHFSKWKGKLGKPKPIFKKSKPMLSRLSSPKRERQIKLRQILLLDHKSSNDSEARMKRYFKRWKKVSDEISFGKKKNYYRNELLRKLLLVHRYFRELGNAWDKWNKNKVLMPSYQIKYKSIVFSNRNTIGNNAHVVDERSSNLYIKGELLAKVSWKLENIQFLRSYFKIWKNFKPKDRNEALKNIITKFFPVEKDPYQECFELWKTFVDPTGENYQLRHYGDWTNNGRISGRKGWMSDYGGRHRPTEEDDEKYYTKLPFSKTDSKKSPKGASKTASHVDSKRGSSHYESQLESERGFQNAPKSGSQKELKRSSQPTPKSEYQIESKRNSQPTPKNEYHAESKRNSQTTPKTESEKGSQDVPKRDSQKELKRSSQPTPKTEYQIESKRSSQTTPKTEYQIEPKRSSHATPKTEYQIESKRSSQATPKSETQTEPKRSSHATPKTEYQIEPKRSSQDTPKSESQTELKRSSHASPKTEYQIESKRNSQTTPKTEYHAESKRSSHATPITEYHAESKRGSQTTPKTEYHAESKRGSQTAPKSETQTEPKRSSHASPKTEYQIESKRGSQTAPKSEPQTEPKRSSHATPKNEYQTDSKRSSQTTPKNEYQTESKRNSQVDSKPYPQTESKRGSHTDLKRESQPELKEVSQVDPRRDSQSGSKRGSLADSKRGSLVEYRRGSHAEVRRDSQQSDDMESLYSTKSNNENRFTFGKTEYNLAKKGGNTDTILEREDDEMNDDGFQKNEELRKSSFLILNSKKTSQLVEDEPDEGSLIHYDEDLVKDPALKMESGKDLPKEPARSTVKHSSKESPRGAEGGSDKGPERPADKESKTEVKSKTSSRPGSEKDILTSYNKDKLDELIRKNFENTPKKSPEQEEPEEENPDQENRTRTLTEESKKEASDLVEGRRLSSKTIEKRKAKRDLFSEVAQKGDEVESRRFSGRNKDNEPKETNEEKDLTKGKNITDEVANKRTSLKGFQKRKNKGDVITKNEEDNEKLENRKIIGETLTNKNIKGINSSEEKGDEDEDNDENENANPKNANDLKVSKNSKDLKDSNDQNDPKKSKEPKEPKDAENLKDLKNSEDPKDSKESKDSKDFKESKHLRDSKDSKDSKDSGDSKDSKDAKDSKGAKDLKDLKGLREPKESKDSKDKKDSKDLRNSTDSKDPKDSTDSKDPKDSKNSKDPKDSKDSKDLKDSKNPMDVKDSKDLEDKPVKGFQKRKSKKEALSESKSRNEVTEKRRVMGGKTENPEEDSGEEDEEKSDEKEDVKGDMIENRKVMGEMVRQKGSKGDDPLIPKGKTEMIEKRNQSGKKISNEKEDEQQEDEQKEDEQKEDEQNEDEQNEDPLKLKSGSESIENRKVYGESLKQQKSFSKNSDKNGEEDEEENSKKKAPRRSFKSGKKLSLDDPMEEKHQDSKRRRSEKPTGKSIRKLDKLENKTIETSEDEEEEDKKEPDSERGPEEPSKKLKKRGSKREDNPRGSVKGEKGSRDPSKKDQDQEEEELPKEDKKSNPKKKHDKLSPTSNGEDNELNISNELDPSEVIRNDDLIIEKYMKSSSIMVPENVKETLNTNSSKGDTIEKRKVKSSTMEKEDDKGKEKSDIDEMDEEEYQRMKHKFLFEVESVIPEVSSEYDCSSSRITNEQNPDRVIKGLTESNGQPEGEENEDSISSFRRSKISRGSISDDRSSDFKPKAEKQRKDVSKPQGDEEELTQKIKGDLIEKLAKDNSTIQNIKQKTSGKNEEDQSSDKKEPLSKDKKDKKDSAIKHNDDTLSSRMVKGGTLTNQNEEEDNLKNEKETSSAKDNQKQGQSPVLEKKSDEENENENENEIDEINEIVSPKFKGSVIVSSKTKGDTIRNQKEEEERIAKTQTKGDKKTKDEEEENPTSVQQKKSEVRKTKTGEEKLVKTAAKGDRMTKEEEGEKAKSESKKTHPKEMDTIANLSPISKAKAPHEKVKKMRPEEERTGEEGKNPNGTFDLDDYYTFGTNGPEEMQMENEDPSKTNEKVINRSILDDIEAAEEPDPETKKIKTYLFDPTEGRLSKSEITDDDKSKTDITLNKLDLSKISSNYPQGKIRTASGSCFEDVVEYRNNKLFRCFKNKIMKEGFRENLGKVKCFYKWQNCLQKNTHPHQDSEKLKEILTQQTNKLKADNIKEGSQILSKLYMKNVISELNKMQKKKTFNTKMNKFHKTKSTHLLRRYFTKWYRQMNKISKRNLKGSYVKSLKRQQSKKLENTKLSKAFNKWKNMIFRKKANRSLKGLKENFNQLLRLIKGETLTQLASRVGKYRRFPEKMGRAINSVEKNEKIDLHRYFNRWHNQIVERGEPMQYFNQMFSRVLKTKKNRYALINNQFKELSSILREIDATKLTNSKLISDFCQGILMFPKTKKVMKRNVLLNKNIKQMEQKDIRKLGTNFMKWRRIASALLAKRKATKINNFIKKIIRRRDNKKNSYKSFSTDLVFSLMSKNFKAFQEKCSRLPTKDIKKAQNRKLGSVVKNLELKNERVMRKAFAQYRAQAKSMEDEIKILKLQTNFRKRLSLTKLTKLKQLNLLLKKRILLRTISPKKLMSPYFTKWKRETKLERMNKNAKIIQNFLRPKLKELSRSKAKFLLMHCAYNRFIDILKTAAKKPTEDKKNKAYPLFDTLNRILLKKPKGHLLNAIKWLARIKTLKGIIRKVPDLLQDYFARPAINKWREKTFGNQLQKIKLIQRRVRKFLKQRQKERGVDITAFLKKYLHKKQNDKEWLTIIRLRKWYRKSCLLQLYDPADVINKVARGYLYRHSKQLEKIKQPLFEKRQKLMLKSAKIKKEIQKADNNLYYYWRIFVLNTRKTPQEIFEEFLASRCLKLENFDGSSLKYYLRKWNKIARRLKADHDSRVIQRFIRECMKDLMTGRLQKLMDKCFKKNALKDLSNFSKVNRINKLCMKNLFKKFSQKSLEIPNKFFKVKSAIHRTDNYRKNLLKAKFNQYRKIVSELIANQSAKLIQRFLRKGLEAINQRNLNRTEKEKEASRLFPGIDKAILNHLRRRLFDSLKKTQKESHLKSILRFPGKTARKNLFNGMRKKVSLLLFKTVFAKLVLKKRNMRLFNLRKWSHIAETMRLQSGARKIYKFVLSHWKSKKAFDKWSQYSEHLLNEENAKYVQLFGKLHTLLKALHNIEKRNLRYFLKKRLLLNLQLKKLVDASLRNDFVNSFNKWREKSEEREKFFSLKTEILEGVKDAFYSNKLALASKIYKIYIYKKLLKFAEFVKKKQLNLKKESFKNVENFIATHQFSLPEIVKKKRKPKLISMSFSKKQTPRNVAVMKETTHYLLLPPLVKLLSKTFNKPRREIFKGFYYNSKGTSFCKLYKDFAEKKILPLKKSMVSRMHIVANFTIERLIIRQITHNVVRMLKDSKNVYNLQYIIYLTFMNKKIAKMRFIKKVMLGWNYFTKLKNLKLRKMSEMYRNFSLTYLNLANDMFGNDNPDNPSIQQSVSDMLSNY